jgi:glycosyltransferase involved in cell wall biosynthesis
LNSIKYSILIPVFGAENSLVLLNNSIKEFFETKYTYEIIYINDCSLDNSWEVLKKIKSENNQVTIINFNRNFGQHAATICGFKHAKGDFIITLDDDLEAHPKELEKLILSQEQTNADLVYGVYKKLNGLKKEKVAVSDY